MTSETKGGYRETGHPVSPNYVECKSEFWLKKFYQTVADVKVRIDMDGDGIHLTEDEKFACAIVGGARIQGFEKTDEPGKYTMTTEPCAIAIVNGIIQVAVKRPPRGSDD